MANCRPRFEKGYNMYFKPAVERFGNLRDLTQFGAGPDCDGGALGVAGGPGDGSSNRCYATDNGRS